MIKYICCNVNILKHERNRYVNKNLHRQSPSFGSRGILYSFKSELMFNEEENWLIESLLNQELIAIHQPYAIRSIITLVTTTSSAKVAKEHLQNSLQNREIASCSVEGEEFEDDASEFEMVIVM